MIYCETSSDCLVMKTIGNGPVTKAETFDCIIHLSNLCPICDTIIFLNSNPKSILDSSEL